MSSFRQYGGLNRAATNNIVRNQYSNSDNPTISNYLGQYNSKIVSESHLDLSGNSILNVNGIYFDNGTTIIDGSFNGDLTVNGNLEVTKNTKLDGSLNVFGDVSLNSTLEVGGVATFLSSLNGVYINTWNRQIYPYYNDNIVLTTTQSCVETPGSNNVLIGTNAGKYFNFDCSCNTALGYNAYSSTLLNVYSYSTAIGYNAQPTGDHQIVLGTAAETVIIDGSLNVLGDVSFNSTLEVAGDVSLNSTLEVGGIATFDASMVVYGDASFNSTLEVGGIATFDASMVVYGDVSLNYTLNVGGDVSFNNHLSVAGDVSFNSDLNVAGTTTSLYFVSGSDYRIKTDVKPLDTTFKIDQLNPVSYTNKVSGKQDTGFIAHEVQEIFPHLVTGEKDGEETQTLNYLGLIAILTKEIQELKKRVEILEKK
jgi:predicted acyltransferase (DUF342 family)